MITLAIDTASAVCAVAIVENGSPLAHVSEKIGKGHAEKLIGQIIAATKQADLSLDTVDRIAVNIGPGSFTGVRIGVATARALALALERPVIGVGALEAIAFDAHKNFPDKCIVAVIDAGHEMIYRQDFDEKLQPVAAAHLESSKDIAGTVDKMAILAGPFAQEISKISGKNRDEIYFADAPDIVSFALLAEKKTDDCPAKPLYLRDANAKPQSNFALPRKQE